MIMTDYCQPASPSPPMSRKQSSRVDLESPRSVRRHVRARLRCLDQPRRPEQQPADLGIRRRICLRDQPLQQFA